MYYFKGPCHEIFDSFYKVNKNPTLAPFEQAKTNAFAKIFVKNV